MDPRDEEEITADEEPVPGGNKLVAFPDVLDVLADLPASFGGETPFIIQREVEPTHWSNGDTDGIPTGLPELDEVALHALPSSPSRAEAKPVTAPPSSAEDNGEERPALRPPSLQRSVVAFALGALVGATVTWLAFG